MYNDDQRSTARLQIQKGKVGIDMSKPGTTKYKTGRISFFLSVSTSLFASLPHTQATQETPGRAESRIIGTRCVCLCVCMCGFACMVKKKKKGSDGKRNEMGREEEESRKSRVNTHHTHLTPSRGSHLSPLSPRQ